MTTAINHVGSCTDRETVHHQRLLPGSIEQVWAYLTEPALMARWLAGGTVELFVGGRIDLDFDLIQCPGREEVHGRMHGVITEFDPPKKLTFTWQECWNNSEPDSLVTFELAPASGNETLLTLTHTRIVAKDLPSIAAGWHIHITVLVDRMEGKEPGHFMNNYYAIEPSYKLPLSDAKN